MALVGNISGSGGTSNTIGITGSLIIANPGLTPFPVLPGNDVALFISGNVSSKPSTSPDYSVRGTTVFGGDVVISGTLFGGSPLYIGSHISASAGFSIPSTAAFVADGGLSGSLQQIASGKSYLVAGSNVTITSESNGQIFISSTGGGGGTGTNFFTESALGVIYNSGSVAFTGARTGTDSTVDAANDKGTSVTFYVSGSTDGTASALFGGTIVTSGSLSVVSSLGERAYIAANGAISGSGNLSVGGNITVAGDIDTDAAEAKSLFASAGANNITIGGATSTVIAANTLQVNGNITTDANEDKEIFTGVTSKTITIGGGSTSTVRIPGNLTVNGTVVAIDTTNLRVKDAIVLIGSGTTSTSFQSIIAFSSGSKTGPNSLTFGASGGDDTLAAGIQDVKNGEETSISFASLAKVKAAAFKVATESAQIKAGGTADSITVSGSQISLQSPPASGVTFQSSVTGNSYASVDQAIGDTTFKGVGNTWFSGSAVYIQADTGTVSITKNTNSALALITDGATAGTVAAKLGNDTARTLTLTGSTVTIGANTSNSGITFTGAGANLVNLSAATSTTPSFVASQTNATFKVGTGGGTTDAMILSGTAIQFNAGSSGQSFRRDNTEFLLISSGANGPNQRTLITAAAGKTFVIGGTSETILSGSSLTLLAGTSGSPSGIALSTDVLGQSQTYANITTGSYSAGPTTSLNVAQILGSTSPITPKDLLLGASNGKDLFLSGTNVKLNAGAAGTAFQRDGADFISLSSPGPNQASIALSSGFTTFNLANTVATSINFGGAATAMKIASGSGTSVEIGGSAGRTTVYNDFILGTGNILVTNDATPITLISSGNILAKLDINNNSAGHKFEIQDWNSIAQFTVNENGNAWISGSLVTSGSTTLGNVAGVGTVTFNNLVGSSILPSADKVYDLGSPTARWANMYTGDLHLKNERGDWTIIEEKEYLSITNNKSGRRFKFVLEEI